MLNRQIVLVRALPDPVQKTVIIVRKSCRSKIAAPDGCQTRAGGGNDAAFFGFRQNFQFSRTVFKEIIDAVDFQGCYNFSVIIQLNKCGAVLRNGNQFFVLIIELNDSAGRRGD